MIRTIRLLAAVALVPIALVVGAAPAQAHSATGGASCAGAVLDAGSYDDALANTYSLTVGQETVTGTFGSSVHQEVPVPQDGAVHDWAYTVQAEDGTFQFADSGQVGPCGTPPVVDLCPELTGDQPAGTSCTPPPDLVAVAETTDLDCEASEQVTTTTTTTTAFVFDQTSQTWVAGTPVDTQFFASTPVEPGDCTEPPVDECVDLDGVQTGEDACDVGQPTSYTSPPTHVVNRAPALVLPAAGAPIGAGSATPAAHVIGAGVLAAGLGLLGGLLVLRRRALAA